MRRIIHREGTGTISLICTVIGLLVLLTGVASYYYGGLTWSVVHGVTGVVGVLLVLFFCRFFRVPNKREVSIPEDTIEPNEVLAPADGTVVAIEETSESEVFGGVRMVQVSVFMSVWNVHINWFPVGGMVEYVQYHKGKFLVAWHPKSSTDNERTTTVVRTNSGHRVLFRQIAGFVARRIVNYALTLGNEQGEDTAKVVKRGEECGFIKFGSRVDIFLPLDSKIQVSLNQKVTGRVTRIATLPSPSC
jgi:phosphatidylserine decarboxylase